MTTADILRMAREAGLHKPYWEEDQDPKVDPPHWAMASPIGEPLERFAALVAAAAAAAEREACAKIADAALGDNKVSDAIRARGEKP